MVDLLLKKGADPNCTRKCVDYPDKYHFGYDGNDTVFPLMIFAKKGDPGLVKLLLEGGANINQVNSRGQTALHGCCIGPLRIHTNGMMKVLLKHEADINVQDASGRTALHYACENGSVKEVDILLEAGAQMNIVDSNGFTELHLAALSDNDPKAKVERLVESHDYPLEVIIEAYETLVFYIARSHNFPNETLTDAVTTLLKAESLREEHGLLKTASTPLECYNFTYEWMTRMETQIYGNTKDEVLIRSIIARERIYKGRLRFRTLENIMRQREYSLSIRSEDFALTKMSW